MLRLGRYLCPLGMLLLPLSAPGFDYATPALSPESGSGFEEKPGWATESFAVVAANPLAADAGEQILEAGGNAIDAAIAVQMVLALVEPQSSGIGGGGFMLHFDGRKVTAFDGRETAPAGADETLFLDDAGKPLAFMEAVTSGRSVGVPGVVKMLEKAHDQYGRLDWETLFAPVITLAEDGFKVSPRLHQSLADDDYLPRNPAARAFYYTDDGDALPVGDTLTNPALAAMLEDIARHGSGAFYRGSIASDLADRVQSQASPGTLTVDDLDAYTAKVREPLCTPWQRWDVCGFPPPSSGHLTIMQTLGLLAHEPMARAPLNNGAPGSDWLHRFIEASRLAFADRNRYIGDPAFVEAPGGDWQTLLAPAYLQKRAELISRDKSLGESVSPGQPGELDVSLATPPRQPEYGTSHISIVDADGNAIAMTTSVEQAFGSRILADGGTGLAGGYLLNNQLTDFSFTPEVNGKPVANRVQPGKRPRSSMSPTLVFEHDTADADEASSRASIEGDGVGRFVASLGSPGGAAIIPYVAQTLVALRDWGLDAQQALALPHALTLGGDVYVEKGRVPEATRDALSERGHTLDDRELTSGLGVIVRQDDNTLFGGADPRREGVVMGDDVE
ncbi:gamma-glutamyltransferase family protein [Vreelandella jeotgali]|uniref:gamma-glutamyltransferase family protein n=1 Tax=Vreelandella jeotgali TaxID=553386 RepID=UPI0003455540|nr:gamma-glutamyltransferase family protein [Halomonas jeotgali]